MVSGLLLRTLRLRALQNLENSQFQRRKKDLWSYHGPNYFSRLVPGGNIWNVIGTTASISFQNWCPFFKYYYFADSQWKQMNMYYSFLNHFFPVFPFTPSGVLRKSFQELWKGNIGKKVYKQGYQKENFPYGFLVRS